MRRQHMLLGFALFAIVGLCAALLLRPVPSGELTDESRMLLLRLARQELEAQVLGSEPVSLDDMELPDNLRIPGSAFVSLHGPRGELRGCMIDRFEAHEPLAQNVLRNIAFAFHDDRFDPVSASELAETTIEISILTPPTPISFDSPEELLDRLKPGEDGVILRVGDAVSTFLPYVWEELADPEAFLSELCLKQGLPADRWRTEPYPLIEIYRVETLAETAND